MSISEIRMEIHRLQSIDYDHPDIPALEEELDALLRKQEKARIKARIATLRSELEKLEAKEVILDLGIID